MKKNLLIAFLSFIISCTSQKGIEYHITKGDAQSKLIENIKNYENIGYDIFLIFGRENEYNLIDIIPTKDKKEKKVQGLKLSETNRKLMVNGRYYYVFFDFDNELAATIKEEMEDGKKVQIVKKITPIYDHATTLYFDKDWNFIKKSSLINFK